MRRRRREQMGRVSESAILRTCGSANLRFGELAVRRRMKGVSARRAGLRERVPGYRFVVAAQRLARLTGDRYNGYADRPPPTPTIYVTSARA